MTDHRPAGPGPSCRRSGNPGPRRRVARVLRVNHAGEYGAKRIYEGQLAVLRGTSSEPAIREMADEERRHLDAFADDLAKRGVRPTVLLPVWHVAGFALGAATALLGPSGAMACTEAVEEVIDGHYARQEETLDDAEAALRSRIREFRADEVAHRDRARREGAAAAPGYNVLRRSVRASTRLAIWLSERV